MYNQKWITDNSKIKLLNKKIIIEKNKRDKLVRRMKDKSLYINYLFMLFLFVLGFYSSTIINELLFLLFGEPQIQFLYFMLTFETTDPLIAFDHPLKYMETLYAVIQIICILAVFYYMAISSFILDENKVPYLKWIALTMCFPFPMLAGLSFYILILFKRVCISLKMIISKSYYNSLKIKLRKYEEKITKLEDEEKRLNEITAVCNYNLYEIFISDDFKYFLEDEEHNHILDHNIDNFNVYINLPTSINNIKDKRLKSLLSHISIFDIEFKENDNTCLCLNKVYVHYFYEGSISFEEFEGVECNESCISTLKNFFVIEDIIKVGGLTNVIIKIKDEDKLR